MSKRQMEVLLDLFCWGVDQFSLPTFSTLTGRFDDHGPDRSVARWVAGLEREGLLLRSGRGQKATLTITATGRERAAGVQPRRAWSKPWDGQWRAVLFDLPMVRQKERYRLWRAFRGHKLGLLQRSVWISPHPIESLLQALVTEQHLPQCWCGLEVRRLFFCTDAEVVRTAWDWGEIQRRQQVYLKNPELRPSAIGRMKALTGLGRLARLEREAYAFAFSLDPLLPAELWPGNYRASEVVDRHEKFRRALGREFAQLAVGEIPE